MDITYRQLGDYQIPNLMLEETKENQFQGKYYQMRLHYLKEHKKGLYTALMMKNKLTEHLLEIQETATKRLNQIIQELMMKEQITEELKKKNLKQKSKKIQLIHICLN